MATLPSHQMSFNHFCSFVLFGYVLCLFSVAVLIRLYIVIMSYRKVCVVPTCYNNSEDTQNKIFIYEPQNPEKRRRWAQALQTKLPVALLPVVHFRCVYDVSIFKLWFKIAEFQLLCISIKKNCLWKQTACIYFICNYEGLHCIKSLYYTRMQTWHF